MPICVRSKDAQKQLARTSLSSSLNKSVSEIQLWASANKLPLNEDKTKVLTITGKRCVANINGSDRVVTINGKHKGFLLLLFC